METRDVVVIGGGPSGYTAALYLARALLKPLVLAGEQKGGQLMFTTEVENYPGFPEGILGPDLMQKMEEQAKKFGAEIQGVNVSKVDLSGEMKRIWVGDEEIQAKTVIISTGENSRMLNIGEEKLLGRGVSTCAVCDAAFYKEKRTVVVGGGDAAMEDALALAKYASEVMIMHRRDEFRASKVMIEKVKNNSKIKVMWDTEVVGVKGEQKLEGLRIKNNKSGDESDIPMDGLFLAIGHIPATDVFKGQVDLDEKGFLRITQTALLEKQNWQADEKNVLLEGYPTMTSVNGVFGCGDVVDYRYRQAVTAAGMGCQAALDAEKFLTGRTASW